MPQRAVGAELAGVLCQAPVLAEARARPFRTSDEHDAGQAAVAGGFRNLRGGTLADLEFFPEVTDIRLPVRATCASEVRPCLLTLHLQTSGELTLQLSAVPGSE